ncbi:Rpn family recombination-promoting nuclease/putative transposase [Marinospirillum sp.]|uniref:Rpn family recombination-promoting nuclease/putative transposase n=1 Tax=Marinospirillum sp. TaxID=2183934 RepID=UPI00286FF385|nr:Rpn family recombination-promoting nuclease/putative transposase [Marinospirillum sp.]MDR9468668.1 Rpn family recombination-promoting nuclease/putative transposase [Marinospirillum sp.]
MNHHDTGYKELFSHPEFVQQLIEGFAPPEIAELMDFSTLQNHSGNYITPLFEEKFEDLVWSVEITWDGQRQQVFLYLLLEFQSTVDSSMPLRLMHYVACFYDHLLKTQAASLKQGLPPVFPIVLYNGNRRWTAVQDIYELINPEPPAFLRTYQPHLRYYLVDEGRYTEQELQVKNTTLSGIFGIENSSTDYPALQKAVDGIITSIQADPNKDRLDKIVTRWLKRHLQAAGTQINLKQLNSILEDKNMLAENLQNWAQKERQEGRQEGQSLALKKLIQLKFGELPDWAEQKIAQADSEQIDLWISKLLKADSLDHLLHED